ncbi:MAG TPA: TIGR01777 family oxidoreductase [Gallionella sp.]
MQILITGGTGLIGRHLCRALLAEGHELTVLSRNPASVPFKCGQRVHAMAALADYHPGRAFDAVINLAGEPIVDARWSARRKQILRDSRVALTRELVGHIVAADRKPAVLISGSAVGYYGDRGADEMSEDRPSGEGFAAQLCRDWEEMANAAASDGVRVCLLRTGLILSDRGGLLGRMLLPFRLGLGARLGNGKQWMSWVHIDDYVAMVLRMLHDSRFSGPYNMTAPQPVTNAEFTAALARALHRPALFAAPALLLKLAMGERAAMLLEGQRVLPARMTAAGYGFRFASLDAALADLLGRP